MKTPNLNLWTDAELVETIAARERAIRTNQERVAILNAEWTRRHRLGPCPTDCREPMAGPDHFGAPR